MTRPAHAPLRRLGVVLVLAGLATASSGCRTQAARDATHVTTDGASCESCHQSAWQAAEFDHASVGYGGDCSRCHTETDWHPTSVPDHAAQFPLQGAHALASCGDCHAAGRADPQPKTCIGCHAADKAAATPSHAAFPDECTTCHTVQRWSGATFDHGDEFPLTGKHASTACAACHVGGRYEGTPSTCVACHGDQRPAEPDHTALPEACQACHNTAAWRPAALDHEQFFPLTGRHATAECGDCHTDGRFSGTPRECIGCHADDRARVADPPHDSLPEACQACHSTTAWRPAALDHNQFFPLVGQHAEAACEACHTNGRYAGTPRACVGCHADDKARAVEPPHGGFPDTCETCHTATAWSPAQFDHAAFYPLAGRHAQIACDACHAGGRYEGTPRTCAGCHADDKAGAQPSHASFPDTCETCHTQNAWTPATYRHRFPVPHRDATACGDCHLNQADFGDFSCIDCHAHTRARMDATHQGEVGGYQWSSQACYRCHPNGRAEDD